jgi:diguanylate cyclase (GGDEF)-like protein
MSDLSSTAQIRAATPAEVLQGALIDSRQRWRELINLAADFAFETDEWGRFTLVTPDPALAWAAGDLIGHPSATLLAEGGGGAFDPFRVSARVRHRQAWLKRGDGGIASLTFCAAPIQDANGRIIGARGIGIDMTELDSQVAHMAGTLRRAEVLDHMLWSMGREVVAARMIDAALDVLANAIGAEGVAVVFTPANADTAQIGPAQISPAQISPVQISPVQISHVTGTGSEAVVRLVSQQSAPGVPWAPGTKVMDGRPVLIAVCQTRFGEKARLVAWRLPLARVWDGDDSRLIDSAAPLIRMVLEREAMQLDMARQARTDSLTGLLNRRAFLEEMERHAARQDRDNQPATLMFADLDNFKPVNDRLGHEAGDEVLRCTAALLRKTFRPTDLVARLGGDEFAIWLNGADHMTAAERAEFLRDAVPRESSEITGPDLPRVGVSIGIACREAADGEPLDSLMRRADRAMYEVKRGGRGHWRVSLLKRP